MTTNLIATNYRTGERLAELPSVGLTHGRRHNAGGPLACTVPLPEDDPDLARLYLDATDPFRRGLIVERDGLPVWSGLIFTNPDSIDPSLRIDAVEDWFYPAHRVIDWTAKYTNTDIFDVLRAAFNRLTGYAGGDVGITVDTNDAGVNITTSWLSWERKTFGALVAKLAEEDPGFEYGIDLTYAGGQLVKTLRFAYPRRGRTADQSGLVFRYPGNILELGWAREGARIANRVHGLGAGQGGKSRRSTSADTSMLTLGTSGGPGYPLLEAVASWPDEGRQAQLNALTRAEMKGRRQPARFYTVTVRADTAPKLGSYLVGDTARFVAQAGADPRFPDGVDEHRRILGWDVTVPDDDDEIETVQLILGDEPDA
jgi:hypothetical protein